MYQVTYDSEADAIYIQFTKEAIGCTKEINDDCMVDYGLFSNEPVGIDLISVSCGVSLDNLPQKDKVRKILEAFDIREKIRLCK